MQNQENKEFNDKLLACREEIDAVDNKILNLLAERLKIVEKVRAIKENNGEKFFIKSSREADMIKNLLKKAPTQMPKSAIISIWRKIITSSNMMEQPLKIAVFNPKKNNDYENAVQDYYADFVPVIHHDSVNNVVLELEKNNVQIAVFALPCEKDEQNNWWINLANNKSGIKIFAKIPFLKPSKDCLELVTLAIKKPEKSSEDETLIYIEADKEISKSQILSALKENKIDGKILKSTNTKQIENITFHLIEAQGYFDEESLEIKNLSKSKLKLFVKLLGCYPKQIH